MKFVIGESAEDLLEMITTRGIIGFTYNSTLGGLLAYLLTFIIVILTLIGLITVIKWIIKKITKPKYKW